ncbi:hypothetical protein ACQEU6_32955 [Spirillospora sp. CA-108201]
MEERRKRPTEVPFPASALHKALLRARVPRFMADHAAALLAGILANRPDRRDRQD